MTEYDAPNDHRCPECGCRNSDLDLRREYQCRSERKCERGQEYGAWSRSGTGSFDPSNTALTGTYQISDADTAAGSVWLTLTFTNNGVCYAETDSVEVTVKTAATVTAASDTILCTEVLDSLSLNGTVSGGSGKGEWSTDGFGSFSPSDTVKDLNYVFNAQDTSMKQLTLTFPSVAACANDTDGATVDYYRCSHRGCRSGHEPL